MPANQQPAAEPGPQPHVRDRAHRTLADLRERGQRTARARAWRLRLYGLLTVQAGIAASIAWFVAYHFLDDPSPIVAPTTAVGIVAASMGSRLRRTIELLAGVTLGLAVGDLLMPFFGIGPWQTGVVVILAITVAVLLKGGGSLITQAGGTAVLIATLEPPVHELSVPRFVDAAVGGLVGLAVGLLLVPIHPKRTLLRLAEPVVNSSATALHSLSAAVRIRNLDDAERSLGMLRSLTPQINALNEGLSAAEEVVRLAPLRWRERDSLAFHADSIRHLERSIHSARSLTRRLTTALKDEEPIPEEFPAAVDLLAASLVTLRWAIQAGTEPRETREQILKGVELVGQAQGGVSRITTGPHVHRLGYSGLIAVGEFRTAAHDLLISSGVETERAARMVRRAGGWGEEHA
ncbi:FUSC family protein [Micromonospora profundi]|uniref:FUSC family protein n=1 Tax=Micromonospora profundi TaxID=1420889 RepID=A0AAJ6HTK5_9ACTN|nr:FUSC family protein [Micromonospora profundi]WLS45882.1 FUSC family protein [Micromonospora profundi]